MGSQATGQRCDNTLRPARVLAPADPAYKQSLKQRFEFGPVFTNRCVCDNVRGARHSTSYRHTGYEGSGTATWRDTSRSHRLFRWVRHLQNAVRRVSTPPPSDNDRTARAPEPAGELAGDAEAESVAVESAAIVCAAGGAARARSHPGVLNYSACWVACGCSVRAQQCQGAQRQCLVWPCRGLLNVVRAAATTSCWNDVATDGRGCHQRIREGGTGSMRGVAVSAALCCEPGR